MHIADRMKEIDSSGIRRMFDLGQKMRDAVDLSIGQPHFQPPPEVREAAIRAIEEGRHRYTLTQGIEQLREDVRRYLREEKGYDPEDIMITSGAAGAIMLAFLVLVNPGDEVVIPDPYFVIYKHLCHLVGGLSKYVSTYPDFELTAERLEEACGKKTKLIVLNNPCNPTGVLLGGESLKKIASLAEKSGAVLISDEVYEFFSYDLRHESAGRYCPSAVVVGGYSKSFGIPGWRVGYAAGPKAVISEMVKLQQYSFVCAPSVLQHALVGALGIDMGSMLDEYRRKRDMVCDGLRGLYRFVEPGGAFYLFPEAPGGRGESFARAAVEKNVLIVPGNVFSERDTHFRISFAASDETLRRGIEILRTIAA